MWDSFLLNLFLYIHPIIVKSAWVEIPQITNNKPGQFVFGAPKVSFPDQKLTTTTPANHRMVTTATTTTFPNYKKLMTTTILPLTTATTEPLINRRNDITFEDTIKAPKEETQQSSNNKTEKPADTTYSGFLPLLHSIQQTLIINAKKSLKSKISLLTNLRDNLLTNIDQRMANLWKRSDAPESRGHYDDHEMDFPSNEGALMTIGFLTFAVFLIKLVLKLIHALKYKNDGGAVVVTTTTPLVFGRKKRDAQEENLKILQFIEEYNFS